MKLTQKGFYTHCGRTVVRISLPEYKWGTVTFKVFVRCREIGEISLEFFLQEVFFKFDTDFYKGEILDAMMSFHFLERDDYRECMIEAIKVVIQYCVDTFDLYRIYAPSPTREGLWRLFLMESGFALSFQIDDSELYEIDMWPGD